MSTHLTAEKIEWPKHPDGRNKKIREMTKEEARAVIKASCVRVGKAEGWPVETSAALPKD